MKDDGTNNVNGELAAGDMNGVIRAIYALIERQYKEHHFWSKQSVSNRLQMFVAKSCELCWVMVLSTPQLYLYPRIFSCNDGGTAQSTFDANMTAIYPQKERKKKKKKKKGKHDDDGDGDKDEEEEMDELVKEHGWHPFESEVFTDKYHECLNEMDGNEESEHIYNGTDIAYCGWPSLVRKPHLESERHTQITKTFVYFKKDAPKFMATSFK